jgi:hypothetical protein
VVEGSRAKREDGEVRVLEGKSEGVNLLARFPLLYPLPVMIGENIPCDAWCPHPSTIYTDNDSGARELPASQHGSTHR